MSYMGWLRSMASSKGENGDSLASSSTSSLSGPPSPANITALADWSPRAAHHHVSEPQTSLTLILVFLSNFLADFSK
jgi:hypothetical protein